MEQTKKITDILKSKQFTISVELVPPRNGTDPDSLMSKIERLNGKVDFISVTKGAGGSMRGGTIPISYFAQQNHKMTALAHFVCRERTSAEIENELMDLYWFKIKNVLALRGDPPAGAKDEEWDGDYKYAYRLANQINNMNQGKYIPRKNFDKGEFREGFATDFCILVAGHPEDPIDKEVEHMKCKIESGASVIITQMIFSFDEYKNYVEGLGKAGIDLPVIAGIRPLLTYKDIESCEKFFGLKVCDELKSLLKDKTAAEARKAGIRYTVDLIKKLKGFGAPGVHLFVLNDVDLVSELIEPLEKEVQ
ncbi:MAG: methylenetetrahydrofolate reductase [Nanoarchaeota archaeon]|nr:methylenetetrahydrofolate reductase [Nanoarchaeota archaeon]